MTSTARVRRIRASSGSSSRLTVSFHNRTELGMNSRATCQHTTDPQIDKLTLSQNTLLGSGITFERGRLEPDLDRGGNLLNGLAENDLCVFGCLDRQR
jgi:hypothetical protein